MEDFEFNQGDIGYALIDTRRQGRIGIIFKVIGKPIHQIMMVETNTVITEKGDKYELYHTTSTASGKISYVIPLSARLANPQEIALFEKNQQKKVKLLNYKKFRLWMQKNFSIK
ncbi:hypothetical protein EZS27_019658 [termite gut metagenome]|uniref:Uncharacterized protein n=1 Tax=termite gut metagenome TaxID=433724 RepID=A0A5J4RCI8_9ZZZZ